MRHRVVGLLVALTVMFGLAACSDDGASASDAPGSAGISQDAVIIDVRDQHEWDAGHLEGAQLLAWNTGEFAAEVGNLDPDAEYFVYCRSGNRAGEAQAFMENNGFTNVTNLGSLEQAADTTSIDIVK